MYIYVRNLSDFFNKWWLNIDKVFDLLFYVAVKEYYYADSEIYKEVILHDRNDLYKFEGCQIVKRKFQLISNFKDDKTAALCRLDQYNKDRERIRMIHKELSEASFWDLIYHFNSRYKSLCFERDNYHVMQISIDELLNIAFYRYQQNQNGSKEDFLKALHRHFK